MNISILIISEYSEQNTAYMSENILDFFYISIGNAKYHDEKESLRKKVEQKQFYFVFLSYSLNFVFYISPNIYYKAGLNAKFVLMTLIILLSMVWAKMSRDGIVLKLNEQNWM